MSFLKVSKQLMQGIVLSLALSNSAQACMPLGAGTLDIVAKMCHTCMFPLMIASVPVVYGPMPDFYPSVRSPVCTCIDPFPRVGIPVSFFEPSRIIEIVSEPFCFPTFGITTGAGNGLLGGQKVNDSSSQHTFMQAHYVIFPVYAIIEVITDFACLQSTGVDYGYLTEVDPLWNSDVMSAFIQPEALLFGNPITNLACIADSISSAFFFPLEPLFWCMGSWGNVYPLTGHKPTGDSFMQDVAGIASKMIYKMHRQLILWGSFGVEGLCGYYPLPIWRKGAYRLQPVTPIPNPIAVTPGQSGMLWDWGKNPPMTFDNFGFLLFKKRDCCVL
jgi:conjugal transfer pilus assembly protein TraU